MTIDELIADPPDGLRGYIQANEERLRRQHAMSLEEKQSVKVVNLGVSVRALNCLQNNGVVTLGGLLRLGPHDLLAWKGCGKTTVREIQEMLAVDWGCALRPQTANLYRLQTQYAQLTDTERTAFWSWVADMF